MSKWRDHMQSKCLAILWGTFNSFQQNVIEFVPSNLHHPSTYCAWSGVFWCGHKRGASPSQNGPGAYTSKSRYIVQSVVNFQTHNICTSTDNTKYHTKNQAKLIGLVIRFNHTSSVTVVTLTDRPKSVRNRCVIEVFCDVFCVVTLHFGLFYGYRGLNLSWDWVRSLSFSLIIAIIHWTYKDFQVKCSDTFKPSYQPIHNQIHNAHFHNTWRQTLISNYSPRSRLYQSTNWYMSS